MVRIIPFSSFFVIGLVFALLLEAVPLDIALRAVVGTQTKAHVTVAIETNSEGEMSQ